MLLFAFLLVAQPAGREQICPLESQLWGDRLGGVVFDLNVCGFPKPTFAIDTFAMRQALQVRPQDPLGGWGGPVCPSAVLPAVRPLAPVSHELSRGRMMAGSPDHEMLAGGALLISALFLRSLAALQDS